MTRRTVCPGWKGNTGRKHRSWRPFSSNEKERRYYCPQCEAYYPYLVDEATGERYANYVFDGQPIAHPDDPCRYEGDA